MSDGNESTIDLPVAELESEIDLQGVSDNVTFWVRLKGQRPDNKCLLPLTAHREFVKAIHEAKKRGGSVWVRYTPETNAKNDKQQMKRNGNLTKPKLIVRDLLE